MRMVRTNGLAVWFMPALLGLAVWGTVRVAADEEAPALPAAQLPAILRNVGVSEHLNGQLPLDVKYFDGRSRRVTLREVMHGRPAILQLGYLECPMLCDQISRSLISTAKQIDELKIGTDYQYIFFSIDPTDTPDLAALKQKSYVEDYDRAGSSDGFHVLIGQTGQIKEMADAVGFKYTPAANGQFAHPAVAIILTPEGRISRYLYGVTFPEQTVRLSLVEASQGKIGTTTDQILLFCFHYDAGTGKYSAAATHLMQMGGALTVLILGGAIFWMARRSRHLERPDWTPPV